MLRSFRFFPHLRANSHGRLHVIASRGMKVFVRPEEVKDGAVFVDARWSLREPNTFGREAYAKERIPGARFFDLEELCGKTGPSTGRHPLPEFETFVRWLQETGLSPTAAVVVYDHTGGGSAAARAWWMLRAAGYNVEILAGGLPAWVEAGKELDTAAPPSFPSDKSIEPPGNGWDDLVVPEELVRNVCDNGSLRLIDCRSAARFHSKGEAVWPDSIPGHIPTARNHPWDANLRPGTTHPLPDDEMKEVCERTLDGKSAKEAIAYCGSGVTACVTIAAMEHAGLGMPRLYAGSWSQWQKVHPDVTE